jgi:multisubunit Na+/H+ antiporter MnhB subunit
MTTVVLNTIARIILPLLLMFSLYLLGRGHNSPGGGFIAGVLAGLTIALQLNVFGIKYVRNIFVFDSISIIFLGLLMAAGTGFVSIVFGFPFLTSSFKIINLPLLGKVEIASAFFFDVGIFLVVVGTVSAIVSTIGGRRRWKT